MESRYKRLGKNSLIVFIGNAGSKIIGILMLPFYTYYLSTAEYGIFDIINTYSIILIPIISCCIADSIFIYPKDREENVKSEYFTSGIIFYVISLIISIIISGFIRIYLRYTFVGENVWWILGLTFSTLGLNYAQQFTRSIDKMIIYSLTGIVHVGLIAVFSFFLLPIYNLNGYLASLIISSILSALFAFFSSKLYHYVHLFYFSEKRLRELLRYGIPLIPNSVMWWLVDGVNRPIMMDTLGTEAIGIYSIASKMPGFLSMIFVVFSNAWGISMLEEFDKPDFNMFFNKTMKILVFVVALTSAILIASSKLLITVLASPDFYEAWMYIPILVLGVMFQHISTLVGGVFMAERKSKYFFYSSIWGATTSVLTTLLLIKSCGLFGVCIAVALSFLCMAVVRIKYAWKHINFFDIRYYFYTVLILVIQCFIYISELGMAIDIFLLIITILALSYLNRNSIIVIIERINSINNFLNN